MGNSHKGSAFERTLAKQLSLWWTQNDRPPRDDVFWRSSQSGGRATERAKKGLKTAGSYGDICAIDPIGQPLLDLWTIELKRGSTIGTPWDLFDSAPTKAIRPFEAAILQAIESHKQADSAGWLLIGQRDRRQSIVYTDVECLYDFKELLSNCVRIRSAFHLNNLGMMHLVAFRLDDFLKAIGPQEIVELISNCNSNRR